MNYPKVQFPKLLFFAGVVTVCFLAPAFLHSCPLDGHDNICGSNPHCLLCSIVGHTVLNPDPSGLLGMHPVSRLPVLIESRAYKTPVYRESLAARAPPAGELS